MRHLPTHVSWRLHRDWRALGLTTALVWLVMAPQILREGAWCCMIEDTSFMLNWTRQFTAALHDGIWYPRWLPESHHGWGNPTFVFYAPLMMYLMAAFQGLTGSVFTALALTKTVGLWVGALGMVALVGERWGQRAGLVAGAVFVLAPFHFFDLYFLGVFQSKLAWGFLPWLLLGADRMARQCGGFQLFAWSYAAICLSHLLSGYMFGPVAFVWALWAGRSTRVALTVLVAATLGAGLAGIYLVPVLWESGLVHLDAFRATEWGRFENNFLFWIGAPKSSYNPPFYPQLGASLLLSVGLGGALWAAGTPWGDQRWRESAFWVVVVGFLLFLMTPLSTWLWQWVPGLQMVLFPTRFSVIVVVAAAALAGVGMHQPGQRSWLVVPFVVLALAMDIDIMRRSCPFSDLSRVDPQLDVEEYVPRTVDLDWLGSDTAKNVPVLSTINGNKVGDLVQKTAHTQRFEVELTRPHTLRIRTFGFPGWSVLVDDKVVAWRTEEATGAMLVDVDAGKHSIEAVFENTQPRRLGLGVSMLSLFLAAMAQIRRRTG